MRQLKLPRWQRYIIVYRVWHLKSLVTLAHGAWFRRGWTADRAIARVQRELEQRYQGREVEVKAWVWRG